MGVDRSKFRTCQDTGFCRSHRLPLSSGAAKYSLVQPTVSSGSLWSSQLAGDNGDDSLRLTISFLSSGAVRVKIAEANTNRWQPTDLLLEKGLESCAFEELSVTDSRLASLSLPKSESFTALLHSKSPNTIVVVHKSTPVIIDLFVDGVLQISANSRSLLHFDKGLTQLPNAQTHKLAEKSEDRHNGKEVVDYGEDGLAIYADGTREEKGEIDSASVAEGILAGDSFNGHTDTQPRGPRSVGIDFSFPNSQHVYGIPEHTSPLSLPTTISSSANTNSHYREPYRLYTLDVFEYELDQPMALYGSIPLMLTHSVKAGKGSTAGLFWFNPSETFIDVSDGGDPHSPHKESHWISESGEVDFFLLTGPTPAQLYSQYTSLTGTQQLPPIFSLGYHQCRWNYRDEKDVSAVNGMFEQLDFPYDVLWLDIEHTDGKRYFTWDKQLFPNPVEMQKNLSDLGRKMVTIVDPHIKRDDGYYIHKEATDKGLYIKDKTGGNFDGWCWPGQSSYLDFTDPEVRSWWADQFSLSRYVGSTMSLFTWNDMNEPSVFNGPEVSMPKDAVNRQGVEHREWHNLYGLYMQMATALGLTRRSPADKEQERPFVLTRSFWAGSQRFGAMWTGDNAAQWGHLKIASPMLLSINLGGLSFAGADVGGFFGEPDSELFTRWYQAGSFTPFFRGHAHHDTKRREPWVFGDPYTQILRTAAMKRYTLLPFWYTVFYQGYKTGLPVMRAMFLEFPNDSNLLTTDDQYMIGDSLLVRPVTEANTQRVSVYLPETDKGDWIDFDTLVPVQTKQATVSVETPLEKIPVFIRPGKVIPRKMRLRRSSTLMFFDPFTLIVNPDFNKQAEGLLYMDDEHSLAHETSNAYSLRKFTFNNNKLSSLSGSDRVEDSATPYIPPNTVERIILCSQTRAPVRVVTSDGKELSFVFDPERQTVTVKKPDTSVAEDWVVSFEY